MTKFPDPVLAAPAGDVAEVGDNIRRLAEKMIDIMVQAGGVGLAGPQAGVGLRIFVASPDGTKENAKVYINPKIELSGAMEANEEGCLSLPGIYANIRRHKSCTVTAVSLDGKTFTQEAEGVLIRVFQHECDHLNGIMIKDRMGQVARIGARKRLKQLEEEYLRKNQ